MKRYLALLFLWMSISPAWGQENPLTLTDCFQKTLAHFESVQVQEEEIRAAEGRYYQALGGALPHLSLHASELIQDTSGTTAGGDTVGSTFVRRSRPEVAITLKQPLFQGLREFRALSGSSADQNKNRLETARAGQLLFLEVAKVFLSVQELEQDRAILESQQGVMKKRIEELRHRVRLGKSRRGEILATESQLATLEAELARVRGQAAVARETFAFLTGLPAGQKLVEPAEAFENLEPVETYLPRSQERADVGAVGENLRLSRSKLALERGGYLPQLNLEANYYPYRVGFQSEIDWDLLLTLEIPLFQGGKTYGLVREAKARLKQAELLRSETSRRSELEVREAYHDLTAARAESASLQTGVQKAAEQYEVQAREYQLGLVSNLETLQVLRDWHEMQRQANRAKHRTLLNSYRLKVAIGETP